MGHAKSRHLVRHAALTPPALASRRASTEPIGWPPLPQQMFAEAVRYHAAGRHHEAQALYRAILAVQPENAEASYNLGLILQAEGRLEEAMAVYRHAIALRPDYHDAYGNLGVALQAAGRLEDAVAVYRHVLALKPDFPMIVCNLGVALKLQGKLDEAEIACRQAITMKPDYDAAYANLAAVLVDAGDPQAAVIACRQAIALRPDAEMPHFNLGTAHKALSQLPQAAAAFRHAIALRENFSEAHFSLGQVLLTAGDFAAGWTEYDWRWTLKEYGWLKSLHGVFAQPLWSGEPLTGRIILVYAEQGMGDTIQFARYARLLQQRGAQVVLAVHPPLVRLLTGMEGVKVVALDTPDLPPFDVHCPLLSLPRWFATSLTSIPGETPYLDVPPGLVEQWRGRLPQGDPLRVGVVWAGNPTQTGDRFRSPRLQAVRRLFDVPGVAFVGLQVGPGRHDLEHAPLPANVLDLGGELADFTDTAAIMRSLDLVVSSCTAPLHLAGALGVPAWGMIPYAPHFPWLLHRADSPWYPSVRLYRQARPGTEWAELVERIAADLAGLAERPREGAINPPPVPTPK